VPDQVEWGSGSGDPRTAGSLTADPEGTGDNGIGTVTYTYRCTNSEGEAGADSVSVIVPFIDEVLP